MDTKTLNLTLGSIRAALPILFARHGIYDATFAFNKAQGDGLLWLEVKVGPHSVVGAIDVPALGTEKETSDAIKRGVVDAVARMAPRLWARLNPLVVDGVYIAG